MENIENGEDEDKNSLDASQITDDQLDYVCGILEALSTVKDIYESPKCRKLRCCIKKLSEYQQQKMYSGMDHESYAEKSYRKKKAKQEKEFKRVEDKKILLQTKLRAGRSNRLRNICDANNMELKLLDGVVEDGYNSTVLPSDGCNFQLENSPMENTSSSILHGTRSCYTCKIKYSELHHFYDSLCPICADLNWQKRIQKCDMKDRICLVTGGRVKIGFQCCLKLLRCGATVIATSRFPFDTALRFSTQNDFLEWKDKIVIYGIDLRDLRHLEYFCDMIIKKFPKIDAIINNACQTVRRPTAYYSHLIHAEQIAYNSHNNDSNIEYLLDNHKRHWNEYKHWCSDNDGNIMLNSDISPSLITDKKVDISTQEIGAIKHELRSVDDPLSSVEMSQLAITLEDLEISKDPTKHFPTNARDINNQQLDLRTKHSWLLRTHEVSTPEVTEVLTINSIAPFVLLSRLKPHMIKSNIDERNIPNRKKNANKIYPSSIGPVSLAEAILSRDSKAGEFTGSASDENSPENLVLAEECSFVVNVSSMEGKFYRRKLETHPHTNMAKAALNMLTRTSASDYRKSNIFMTAVDTG
jgi:NAD(P)-dependent dehydrogenase (short-subunit alcohol dehydrogenase family)